MLYFNQSSTSKRKRKERKVDIHTAKRLIGKQVMCQLVTAEGHEGNCSGELKYIFPHGLANRSGLANSMKWVAILGGTEDFYLDGTEIKDMWAITN